MCVPCMASLGDLRRTGHDPRRASSPTVDRRSTLGCSASTRPLTFGTRPTSWSAPCTPPAGEPSSRFPGPMAVVYTVVSRSTGWVMYSYIVGEQGNAAIRGRDAVGQTQQIIDQVTHPDRP